ncbi:MAG: aminotransferase class I/II-fold pyridoxal phosphate-dependent enzyme [Nocardioidaceae bacterium]
MDNPLGSLTLDQLRQRTSLKWRHHPADVLPLWVAEMDVPARRAGLAGDCADAMALEATPAIRLAPTMPRRWLSSRTRRWGWTVDVNRTAIVPDVMLGIVEVLRARHQSWRRGGRSTHRSTRRSISSSAIWTAAWWRRHSPSDYRIDLDSLGEVFERVTAGGRRAAYLLCSPHNPTGTVHTRDELTAVAQLAAQHRVRVVADEIHAPARACGATHIPYLSLAGQRGCVRLVVGVEGRGTWPDSRPPSP